MKTFTVIIGICLFIFQTNCLAQDAAISISSRIYEGNSEIIIRSPFDFEKQISLKVKPDPRFLPSDVFIKKISEIGLYDDRNVRITSGFDVDLKNDLVLAFSGGTSEIIKSNVNPTGFTITANFKDGMGKFISPPKGALALYTTAGEKLCFEYKDVKIAAPKMSFILLLDRSGSMEDVILDVGASAKKFLKDLPISAHCALVSFNGTFTYHNEYYESCNCGDFKLGGLKAEGKTDLYTPLLSAYESLSRASFKDYQKAVILITDGQIYSDAQMKKKLMTAKKDILTFVYFLGDKDDQELIGLADAYLQTGANIKTSLQNYFHSLSAGYGTQKVLEVRPCSGGKL